MRRELLEDLEKPDRPHREAAVAGLALPGPAAAA